MEITIMNARQSNGTSKQLRQKSWTKSILFSGLIGFNFLTSDAFSSFNMDIDNDRKARINEFVKEHPGFDPWDISCALSSINGSYDKFFAFLNEWISNETYSNDAWNFLICYITEKKPNITIQELDKIINIAIRKINPKHNWGVNIILDILFNIKDPNNELPEFLDIWEPKFTKATGKK